MKGKQREVKGGRKGEEERGGGSRGSRGKQSLLVLAGRTPGANLSASETGSLHRGPVGGEELRDLKYVLAAGPCRREHAKQMYVRFGDVGGGCAGAKKEDPAGGAGYGS